MAILSGGQSSRMGRDKATLAFEGGSFLSHLEETLSPLGPLYLSVGKDRCYEASPRTARVTDIYDGCGPLGGLHALLDRIESDLLFIISVDLPLADAALVKELLKFVSPSIEAVVPISSDGHMHPLCAIYRKDILDKVREQLESGDYKMRDLLGRLRVCYVPAACLTDGERKLSNINTPEEYDRLFKPYTALQGDIPVISLAAYSGSGKTTFLEQVIRELKARGLRLAVIKHSHHEIEMDTPGKDSFRFAEAGAELVAVCNDSHTFIKENRPSDPARLISSIKDVDLILIEGYKHLNYPKILLYREAAGQPAAIDFASEQPLLIVSDTNDWPQAKCPVIGLEDYSGAAEYIIGLLHRNVSGRT